MSHVVMMMEERRNIPYNDIIARVVRDGKVVRLNYHQIT